MKQNLNDSTMPTTTNEANMNTFEQ